MDSGRGEGAGRETGGYERRRAGIHRPDALGVQLQSRAFAPGGLDAAGLEGQCQPQRVGIAPVGGQVQIQAGQGREVNSIQRHGGPAQGILRRARRRLAGAGGGRPQVPIACRHKVGDRAAQGDGNAAEGGPAVLEPDGVVGEQNQVEVNIIDR